MTMDNMAKDPAREDLLILVDGRDCQVGAANKEEAHRKGLLHRAFSVVLMRDGQDGPKFLLSQRALDKYHSAGLWANSCCSHPRVGEVLPDAAYRRTREELGCDAVDLREVGAFVYRAPFADGLCEYEYDHVLMGWCSGEPNPDPAEVAATRWVGAEELACELAEHPERFAAWAFTVLSLALQQVRSHRCNLPVC